MAQQFVQIPHHEAWWQKCGSYREESNCSAKAAKSAGQQHPACVNIPMLICMLYFYPVVLRLKMQSEFPASWRMRNDSQKGNHNCIKLFGFTFSDYLVFNRKIQISLFGRFFFEDKFFQKKCFTICHHNFSGAGQLHFTFS